MKCDDTIKNDDAKFQDKVVTKIGCIPIYWNSTMLDRNELEVCQSAEQLRDASFLIGNMKDVMETYDPPCVEMNTMVIVNKDVPQEKDQLKIVIRYTEDVYQQIENIQDVSFETFFSAVGGFVGIFLGYSFLQIPEMFDDARNRLNSKHAKAKKGKYVIPDNAIFYVI